MNVNDSWQKVWQWLEAVLHRAAPEWQELITWSQTDTGIFIGWVLSTIAAILAIVGVIVVGPYKIYRGVRSFYRLLRPTPPQPTPTETLLDDHFRRMRERFGEGSTAARTLDDVNGLIAERTAAFFGRRKALDDLDRFISQHDRGVLVLTAPWGVGKSAVLARWARNRQEAGASVAWHFFNRTLASTTQPVQALRALIVQLRFLAGAEEAPGPCRTRWRRCTIALLPSSTPMPPPRRHASSSSTRWTRLTARSNASRCRASAPIPTSSPRLGPRTTIAPMS